MKDENKIGCGDTVCMLFKAEPRTFCTSDCVCVCNMFPGGSSRQQSRKNKRTDDFGGHGEAPSTPLMHSSFLLSSRGELMGTAMQQQQQRKRSNFFYPSSSFYSRGNSMFLGEGEGDNPDAAENGEIVKGVPVGEDSKTSYPTGIIPENNGNQNQPTRSGCCGGCNREITCGGKTFKLFDWTRRRINVFNLFACLLHLMMAVILLQRPDKQQYVLKHDRIHVKVASSVDPRLNKPFLGPLYDNVTCNFAKPNTLNFTNSDGTMLQSWAYPQDANIRISLKACVTAFFLMSFVFQSTVSFLSGLPRKWNTAPREWWGRKFRIPLGYLNIFYNNQSDDQTLAEAVSNPILEKGVPKPSDTALILQWCSRMLSFNVLRFYEYSISGSLVLVTIAMVAGITDSELLMCIYLLAGACMIFGLVAEYAMRGRVVLNTLKEQLAKKDGYDKLFDGAVIDFEAVLRVMSTQLHWVFWISHILAWFCIGLPWYIIVMHYRAWWEQCQASATPLPSPSPSPSPSSLVSSSSLTPAAGQAANKPPRSTEPPDFVQAIVVLQVMLYMVFGVVQLVQYKYPHKRRTVEVTYIFLSLSAKILLGAILAANVLM